jgi:hypothetical protein
MNMRPFFEILGLLALAACTSPAASPEQEDDAASDGSEACPVYPKNASCTDPKSPPSYASDIVPIIQARCSPCHLPGGIAATAGAQYDFSVYANVDNAETAILNELATCSMPPINGYPAFGIAPMTVPGISTEQVDTFVDWFECGAPNN